MTDETNEDDTNEDADVEAETLESKVDDAEPKICLDQFLKTCGVATGGQAKRMIQGGEVLVNNEVETRRRKKLKPGDEVQIYDDIFVVALAEPE
jgi:ribosome-associated protein